MRPAPGDRYMVTTPFMTYSGKWYTPGDIFELVEETVEAPFGHKSKISNWYVRCPHFAPPEPESVWSGIWAMIEAGVLKRVEP